MSGLDWPLGWDRTSPAERERNRSFQASLGATTKELATEMDRMDVDHWRASIGNQHTKANANGLPLHNANPDDPGFVLRWTDDGEDFAVACDAYSRLRDNVREVFLWIHETRMRGNRAVQTGDTEFAAARLPPGDESDVVVAGREAPHEVLGVAPDASKDEVRNAYTEQLFERHPDHGGTPEAFQELNQAREAMMDG